MDLISKYIFEKILDKLSHLQSTEDIKIIFACESGSRACEFPSEDSDYDVRFIYIIKPEFYLSIDHQKDVIEHKIEDNLDLSGWDIKKALTLFKKF